MRIKSIKWCEDKIASILSKQPITTELAMSAVVLKNVQSLDEQHNLDIALANLISQKLIVRDKDIDGFTVFKMAS
jgi:hypothetical protein